ncbi:zinc finger RNA-binding protein isoform X3 [Pararge aegeria]|uniref:zinc finger RNA-binding protein isoform X3 n=1 Tax=Pararge aegeria TaxID=116150 RepID=UPI0019CFC798|nr:zinc finger RNA-binding protein isoform X3 [Pararge aegeria]
MMAANNYFGFTHGGTQYGAATASAAYGGQTGYAVAPAATAATYGTQRAAATGYDTAYQAAAATQGNLHAAHAHAHAAAAAASAYDASKSAYYQQAAAAYPTAAPPQPQPAYDTTAKPAYSTPATYAQQYGQGGARGGGGAKATYGSVYTATTAAASYPSQPYTAPAAQPAKQTANRGNSAYDTALYNAASMYVAQQNKTGGGGSGWKNYNKTGVGATPQRRPKPQPKAQQLHYCDVCRISCAGPQTYKEHLEGQKHKKKEAAVKVAAAGGGAGARACGASALRCELCDVTCTGADAYAAHVRGIKHQKVVKLHTMLGKPIPSTEPTKLTPAKKTVAGAPKVSFVASGGLSTVASSVARPADKEDDKAADDDDAEPEVQPVGQDYIEEIRGDDGKALSFNCKLCDCKFNDPNAKEMHMKGRRHRLQYKKKVQPDLEVKVKPSMHQRKLAEAKAQRMMVRDELWARRRMHESGEEDERAYWEGADWWRGGPHHHHHAHGMGMGYGPVGRRPETSDDRHVLAKHADIYPPEQQLQEIQRAVSHTEKALKSLSDALADHGRPKGIPAKAVIIKTEDKKDDKPEGKEDGRDNQLFSFVGEGEAAPGGGEAAGAPAGPGVRALKGVMRVGLLAKGLLLRGDRDVRLVVLCHDRPTITLLKRAAADLPHHLNKVKGPNEDTKYKVELQPAEGAVQVSDGTVNVLVSLTSAVMREPAEGGDIKRDDKDVLPRQKCLDALAALRHAKWFQARAASLQSCVIIIRIMRDLCRRIPNWTPLNPYAMELLVSGVMQSANGALSPGEALRRVMEALAGGLILEHGPGLRDPCEKELVDALGNMPAQKREDMTASAQQFLRQIAFRQIHKVLDMEPLPKVKHVTGGWKFPRKRRRSNTDADQDTPNGEGKVVKTEEKTDASENSSNAKK